MVKPKSIRQWWKEHETEFPALASLAHDVLTIPATGAGVERLFNSARDICHYRRGSLNANTIKDLMLWKHATKFEVESTELALHDAYLTEQDTQARQEEKDQPLQELMEPISEDEEGENESTELLERHPTVVVEQSSTYREEDEEIVEPPLPLQSQRQIGRTRKRIRRDDFIEY